ncbi:MFS general substrate transporter [Massarina eburnea CBS 473.64]|uniref:MFS general substrate transporter n=1 Tax=Massarina eburnea CBS 473.64 TaxID=1395130 RepID=A0A6A6S7V2_9PLEO|nr:MFS general substrate transporter [Massarina eburnea CBS 473.64]
MCPQSNSSFTSVRGLRLQLYMLGLIRFTEAVAWTSIFPYAYFMIRSFHVVSDSIALWAGVLVSVFTFCEFISGMPWAWVANRIGRRNTLLIGIIGNITSTLLFGLSRNIYMAVIARGIGGLTNPNVGVVQTCVGELATRREQQAKAFSIAPYLRALGNLVGPVIGGYLAEPNKQYPKIFSRSEFWITFPFFLPNLAVVALLVLTFAACFLFLEETLPARRDKPNVGSQLREKLHIVIRPLCHEIPMVPQEHQGDDDGLPTDIERRSGQLNSVTTDDSQSQVFTNQVIQQILSVSFLAFHKVASDIIMPVFPATPTSNMKAIQHKPTLEFGHGFGLSTKQIAPILLVQAVVAIVAQYVFVPRIINVFGALRVYRLCLWIYGFTYLFTPFTALLKPPGAGIAVTCDLVVKVVLSSTGYTCSAILDHLAKVNGASASFGCLSRSVGPLVAGRLFDWGIQIQHIIAPFWIISGIALLGAMQSILLKDHP